MELRELEYFIAVSEELHFGRAAERLHVAQPSVSQQIARLERELGVRLFQRSSRAVRLTPAGAALLPQATRVLAEVEATKQLASELVAGERGTLRVGAIEGMGWRLQQTLLAFVEVQPNVAVSVTTGHTTDKIAALRRGDLDVAFVLARDDDALPNRSTPDPDDLTFLELWVEPVLAVLPQRHRFATVPAVSFTALSGMPVMLSPREQNPDVYDNFLALARAADVDVVLGPTFRSLEEALATVAASADLWFPFHAQHNALLAGNQIPGVAVVPFADLDLRARASLAWPVTSPAPTVRSFVDTVRRLRHEGAFDHEQRQLLVACDGEPVT